MYRLLHEWQICDKFDRCYTWQKTVGGGIRRMKLENL